MTGASAPPALVVTGAPGSGKSTLGAVLAQRLPGPLVDIDTLTADLTGVVARLLGVDDLDDPRLADATRGPRYAAVLAVAEENLRLGHPVVLVAPFTQERRDPAAWARLADRLVAAGGAPRLVWLELDAPTLSSRLHQRGAERDAPKLADAARASGMDLAAPASPHLRLDAARPVAELVDQVLSDLR